MEIEFLDIDKRNAWGTVFQEIKNESNNYCHIIKDAKKSENKNLNRYRDVNPFDHSRVKLQRGDKDYINASLVKVPSADRSYILTQGPLPLTTGHFWLMVWEQQSKAILMLNRVIEKNAVKCHQYWPVGSEYGGENELLLSDVNLDITFISQTEESHYILRKFQITDLETQDTRIVLQFHYTTWPDFGVPESPSAFLNFLFAVRESGALNSNVGPPIVHCSAGIGRSGTFCLVDSCLVLIEKNKDPNSINIRQRLLEMRHYRMGLIQTPDQLRFSYLAIIEGAKRILSVEDSCNVPLTNENSMQDANCTPLPGNQNVKMCDEEKEFYKFSPPPPLPPRIYHIEDLSQKSFRTLNFETNQKTNSIACEYTNFSHSEPDLQPHQIQASNSHEKEENSGVQPLPEEVSSKDHDSSGAASENLSEIRKRARKEREEKTANIVQNIKKKQKETELWEKQRSKRKRRE